MYICRNNFNIKDLYMGRNLKISITGDQPLDAFKAITKRIGDIENKYNSNPSSVTDVTTAKTVVTGATPYAIYVYTLTTVVATGTYTAVFVEKAPNVESIKG